MKGVHDQVEEAAPATAGGDRAAAAGAPAALVALRSGQGGPRELAALQRAAGNAAVGRALSRSVSPAIAPPATELAKQLGGLHADVQAVLHRRGKTRVARPSTGWETYKAEDERIDFDWTALLFVLHRDLSNASANDWFTILNRLMIPALRGAAASPNGRTPAHIPNLNILDAGMWARNPPPRVKQDKALRERWEQITRDVGTEGLLTEAGARARQANVTDISAPDRRDQDFAFIMGGAEGRGARNQFYRTAGTFYREKVGRDKVFTRASLVDVLEWIRQRAARFKRLGEKVPPLGTIYIVSHANRSGFLSFRMTPRGPQGFFGFELEGAVAGSYDRGDGRPEHVDPLGADEGVDGLTRIFIRGCDVGRDRQMLNALSSAFGGLPLVHAPKEAQFYGPVDPSARGGGGVGEGLADTYFLEFPARERRTDDQLITELAGKYPAIGEAKFREWMQVTRGGRGNSTVSRSDYNETWGPFTVDYPTRADVPSDREGRESAIRDVISGSAQLKRLVKFEECSWQIAPVGRQLRGTGLRRHFSIHVVRRDAQGKLQQFGLRDVEAFGVDAQPVSERMTSVLWK